jgi:hypothetical protein
MPHGPDVRQDGQKFDDYNRRGDDPKDATQQHVDSESDAPCPHTFTNLGVADLHQVAVEGKVREPEDHWQAKIYLQALASHHIDPKAVAFIYSREPYTHSIGDPGASASL